MKWQYHAALPTQGLIHETQHQLEQLLYVQDVFRQDAMRLQGCLMRW